MFYMPQLNFGITDWQKERWSAAAHDERVSLSEWVRRACDARLPVMVTGPMLVDGVRVGDLPLSPESEVKTSSSGCPGFVPAGTRCKLCGEIHK